MAKYTESDAAKDTGVSEGEARGAWHGARDDHPGRGGGSDDLYETSWRDSADRELRGIVEDVVSGYTDDDRESSSGYSDSGGSGIFDCYIATAAMLGNPNSLATLDALRGWRKGVLEQSPLGMWLSNYYRRTAPSLAQRLPEHPVVARSIRRLFVMPAVKVLRMESRNKAGQAVRDFVLGAIFVSGLVYGGALRRIMK